MTTRSHQIKGWHVLAGLVLFFGAVFAIDGAFIYLALATHPGDDVKDAYVAGLAYNREIAGKREQEALGWNASLAVTPDERGGQIIEITFLDRDGEPVRGLHVDAHLRHPVESKLDRAIVFDPVALGVFRADVDEQPSALWDLVVEARSDRGEVFRLRHRL